MAADSRRLCFFEQDDRLRRNALAAPRKAELLLRRRLDADGCGLYAEDARNRLAHRGNIGRQLGRLRDDRRVEIDDAVASRGGQRGRFFQQQQT